MLFWKKLFKKKDEFVCPTCGQIHSELPAIGYNEPYHYHILTENEKVEISEISNDFCIINYPEQTDRFIRTTLSIKLIDTCDKLQYGIWVSLSEKSFIDYKKKFKKNIEGTGYFGTICNEIRDYNESTIGLHVDVVNRKQGLRPEIIPHDNNHQLIADFKNGISLSEAKKRINKMLEENIK